MNALERRVVPIVVGFLLSFSAVAATCTAGQFDTAFGPAATGGFVQISPWLRGGSPFEGLAFGIDNRMYVIASMTQDRVANYAYAGVVRSAKGGAIDRGFGGNGFITPGGQASGPQLVGPTSALNVDASGRLVVAVFNNAGLAVSRFLPDGLPDAAFGTNGVTQVDLTNEFWLMGLATASDGSVFVGTAAHNPAAPNQHQPLVVKLTPAGTLDSTFGVGGLAFVYPSGYSASSFFRAADIALLPSGSIVITGRGNHPGYFEAFVAKLLPNGALDPAFGSGGFSIVNFGPSENFYLRKLAVQSDGKIVAVGFVQPVRSTSTNPDNAATAARFNTDGSLDTSFGSGGVSQFLFGYNLFGGHVSLQNNGKIIVATFGATDGTGAVPYTPIARLTTSGQLDPAFGSNGIVNIAPAGPTANSLVIVAGDAQLAGNKIIASVSAFIATNVPNDPEPLVAQFLVAIDTGTGPGCH